MSGHRLTMCVRIYMYVYNVSGYKLTIFTVTTVLRPPVCRIEVVVTKSSGRSQSARSMDDVHKGSGTRIDADFNVSHPLKVWSRRI